MKVGVSWLPWSLCVPCGQAHSVRELCKQALVGSSPGPSQLLAVVRASACPRTPLAEAWGWRPELRKLPPAMPRWLVYPLGGMLPQGVVQAGRGAEEPLVAV